MRRILASPTRGFTLIELVVVIGIIAILGALLLTAVAAARDKARKAATRSFLMNIEVSLETYELVFGERPRGGRGLPDPRGAENLYRALTTDSDGHEPFSFNVNQLADTDGNGIFEVVDRWGRPLRYYRSHSTDKIKNKPLIISAGPDRIHQGAAADSDDLSNWQ